MTITLTKTKLAIGVVAVALLAASTAWAATHPFNDVPKVGDPDERFYSEPVQWAWDNALTTGSPSGSDTFKPLDGVTRGENITFNFRYDQNVVQPALADLQADADAAQSDADAAKDDINEIEDVLAGHHWAAIDGDDGTIITATAGVNTSATETQRLGEGRYEVDFLVDDVSGCLAMVSLVDLEGFTSNHGFVYAEGRSGDSSSIYVDTDNTSASNADRDFTLHLFCDPALAPALLGASANPASGDPATQGLN